MKVCTMCGAQNEDAFTKCATCGADLPSVNSAVGDDEKTVLLDPEQNAANESMYGQQPQQPQPAFTMAQPEMNQPQPGFGQPQPGFGQPQPGFGQPQPYVATPVAPQKKSKKGVIIGVLAALVVVLAVAFVLIFKGGLFGAKGGVKSPEDVAKQFITAMDKQDVDMLAELCPPFLDPGKDELQGMIDMYAGYDVKFTFEGVENKEDLKGDDLKDLQDDVCDYAEKKVKLDAACKLEFSFNTAVTMLGETYDESSSYEITCIKYKGNWYLYE